MKNPLSAFRLRFTTPTAICIAVLIPAVIEYLYPTRYLWWGVGGTVLATMVAIVTFRGRLTFGWLQAFLAWAWRRRAPLEAPSEPAVGATVQPGDHVAVRWEGNLLVALIELIPRPFTPTTIISGHAHTDDVIDTRLVEHLMTMHCPDIEADVISAGYRVAHTAPPDVVNFYTRAIGSDPAPAHRRSWIMLRADPLRTHKSALRRDTGVAGLIRYLIASTTRIADELSSRGIDAECARSFDDFDHATTIDFHQEQWSQIQGETSVTTAYTAPGGPDVWWSAPADRTITRVRVVPGAAPRSTVLLTTTSTPTTPRGFTRVSGAQRAALQGQILVTDHHCTLPIGSAGVLIGNTTRGYPLYLPFDDIDSTLHADDPRMFTQFLVRAAAAGASITLNTTYAELAKLLQAHTGPATKVAWAQATTALDEHTGRTSGAALIALTPDHLTITYGSQPHSTPIIVIAAPEENRYLAAITSSADNESDDQPNSESTADHHNEPETPAHTPSGDDNHHEPGDETDTTEQHPTTASR